MKLNEIYWDDWFVFQLYPKIQRNDKYEIDDYNVIMVKETISE